MPPRYQPLQIPQALSGPPPGVFNQQATPYEDFERQEAALLAQRLNNQSVGISVDQRQQAYDDQQAERAAVKAKFGAGQEMPDESEVLSVLERLALERGDTNSVMEIQRLRNSNAGLAIRQQSADTYERQVNDPLLAENRRQNAIIKNQEATGTRFRPVSDTALGKLENADGALQSIGEVNGLLQQLDPGALSALKAGQLTGKYKDPGSPAYRMYARLELLKKQVARMNDSGALTELDVSMFQPLTVGSPIYDDANSIAQRMADLTSYIQQKQQSVIKRNEQGYRNMDRFKDPTWGEQNPDDLAQSLGSEQAPARPGMTYMGVDEASGLPIYKKGK